MAVPSAVDQFTITLPVASPTRRTVNTSCVVPAFPSTTLGLSIAILVGAKAKAALSWPPVTLRPAKAGEGAAVDRVRPAGVAGREQGGHPRRVRGRPGGAGRRGRGQIAARAAPVVDPVAVGVERPDREDVIEVETRGVERRDVVILALVAGRGHEQV